MNKPKKPTKPRQPAKVEKPEEFFETKTYTFELGRHDEFNLAEFLESHNFDLTKLSFKDIYIEMEIYGSDYYVENESTIKVTCPERHRNPNYQEELETYKKYLERNADYEKKASTYDSDVEKYNKAYEKWLGCEEEKLKKEKIEQAKKLLKEEGLL